MRICFLAGASSVHTVRWVNEIAARGYDVHLITMHPAVDQHIISRKVSVYQLKIPAPAGYYANFFQAKKLLNKIKPDILHVHYASGYGTLARLIQFKPTLLSVWGSDVYLFPYRSKRNEKIIRKNLRVADGVTATGYALKEQTERFIQPEKTISVIPFGIDLNLFTASSKMDADFITIGTVKSLKPIYGIDFLLHAVALLLDLLGESDYKDLQDKVRVKIVGGGPELKNLQKLAEDLNMADITEFTGVVPNDEVPAYLSKLDIYCALSRSESFGVAVLEASACQLPVVVSDVGGLPEVVRDGKTGFIVNTDKIDDIADKLFSLVIDSEKRKIFGKNGRAFVKEYYEWEQNVTEMEEIYKELLQA